MKIGKICKGAAVMLFLLEFIGSVVLGNELGVYDFNWIVFLYGVACGFVFCLGIYALGEIINQLEYSNSNAEKLYDLLNSADIKRGKNASQTAENREKTQGTTHKWLCNYCGNLTDKTPCAHCGKE